MLNLTTNVRAFRRARCGSRDGHIMSPAAA
jgi:hypothetical protein